MSGEQATQGEGQGDVDLKQVLIDWTLWLWEKEDVDIRWRGAYDEIMAEVGRDMLEEMMDRFLAARGQQ